MELLTITGACFICAVYVAERLKYENDFLTISGSMVENPDAGQMCVPS